MKILKVGMNYDLYKDNVKFHSQMKLLIIVDDIYIYQSASGKIIITVGTEYKASEYVKSTKIDDYFLLNNEWIDTKINYNKIYDIYEDVRCYCGGPS